MPKRLKKNLIGPAIRKMRCRGRVVVTQVDLAAKLEVMGIQLDRSALARIESQDRLVKDIEIVAIARALGVPVQRLFEK